jgi:hypothetical protein
LFPLIRLPNNITVRLGAITPTDGRTDPLAFKRVWMDAAALLRFRPTTVSHVWLRGDLSEYDIQVLCDDVCELMASARPESLANGDSDTRRREREQRGLHPLGAELELRVVAQRGTETQVPIVAINRFLQHLFLAINIAEPGAFSLFASAMHATGLAVLEPPQLTGSLFESAKVWATQNRWPELESMAFCDVWNALGQEVLALNLAREAKQKAYFALLRVSDEAMSDPDRLLIVAQSLEALCKNQGMSTRMAIETGLEQALGPSPHIGAWVRKFYRLRSAIAHGSVPVPRPGQLAEVESDGNLDGFDREHWLDLDAALAVLLALLQHDIASRRNGSQA